MLYRTPLRLFGLLSLILLTGVAFAQSVDLSKSQIYSPTDKATLLRSIEILQTEVQKRTGIRLPIAKKLPKSGNVIVVAFADGSTRTITRSIDPELYRRMGHRADGEIIDDAP